MIINRSITILYFFTSESTDILTIGHFIVRLYRKNCYYYQTYFVLLHFRCLGWSALSIYLVFCVVYCFCFYLYVRFFIFYFFLLFFVLCLVYSIMPVSLEWILHSWLSLPVSLTDHNNGHKAYIWLSMGVFC